VLQAYHRYYLFAQVTLGGRYFDDPGIKSIQKAFGSSTTVSVSYGFPSGLAVLSPMTCNGSTCSTSIWTNNFIWMPAGKSISASLDTATGTLTFHDGWAISPDDQGTTYVTDLSTGDIRVTYTVPAAMNSNPNSYFWAPLSPDAARVDPDWGAPTGLNLFISYSKEGLAPIVDPKSGRLMVPLSKLEYTTHNFRWPILEYDEWTCGIIPSHYTDSIEAGNMVWPADPCKN
jgi:hypothetical protein